MGASRSQRRRRKFTPQSIVRKSISRSKEQDPKKETQNIKVLLIQSKSSPDLLQELKNLHSAKIEPELIIGVNNKVVEEKEEVGNIQLDIRIKRKRTFKKISENLLVIGLLSKKNPNQNFKGEEVEEETMSYFSARSTNSGAFFTARNSFCS